MFRSRSDILAQLISDIIICRYPIYTYAIYRFHLIHRLFQCVIFFDMPSLGVKIQDTKVLDMCDEGWISYSYHYSEFQTSMKRTACLAKGCINNQYQLTISRQWASSMSTSLAMSINIAIWHAGQDSHALTDNRQLLSLATVPLPDNYFEL